MTDLDKISFIQRIISLQNICKSDSYSGLLFIINGPDSRSTAKPYVLQYLFASLKLNDEAWDLLDELVLLIQPISVSVLWT